MKYIIYGLVDPRNGELRYIGKSSSGLLRPRKHWNPRCMRNDKNTHKVRWVQQLLNINLIPDVLVLEIYSTHDELLDAETELIQYYRALGCRLTNIRLGGGLTPEEGKLLSNSRSAESKAISKKNMLAGAITSDIRRRNNLKLRKPIIATNIETGEERWYLSASHAEADGMGSRSAISNVLRPTWRCRTAGKWSYSFVNLAT